MEKANEFVLELQKLLEKYNAYIGTELSDRGIIFYFENNFGIYAFNKMCINKDNVTEIETW